VTLSSFASAVPSGFVIQRGGGRHHAIISSPPPAFTTVSSTPTILPASSAKDNNTYAMNSNGHVTLPEPAKAEHMATATPMIEIMFEAEREPEPEPFSSLLSPFALLGALLKTSSARPASHTLRSYPPHMSSLESLFPMTLSNSPIMKQGSFWDEEPTPGFTMITLGDAMEEEEPSPLETLMEIASGGRHPLSGFASLAGQEAKRALKDAWMSGTKTVSYHDRWNGRWENEETQW